MNIMNPKVDFYFTKAKSCQKELEQLRMIVLDCGLTEELKFLRQPGGRQCIGTAKSVRPLYRKVGRAAYPITGTGIKGKNTCLWYCKQKLDKFFFIISDSQDVRTHELYLAKAMPADWGKFHEKNYRWEIEAEELIIEIANDLKLTKSNVKWLYNFSATLYILSLAYKLI